MSVSEWLALIGLVLTVLGGMLATYVGIRVELAKLGIGVSNFKEDLARVHTEFLALREVVDRRHHAINN